MDWYLFLGSIMGFECHCCMCYVLRSPVLLSCWLRAPSSTPKTLTCLRLSLPYREGGGGSLSRHSTVGLAFSTLSFGFVPPSPIRKGEYDGRGVPATSVRARGHSRFTEQKAPDKSFQYRIAERSCRKTRDRSTNVRSARTHPGGWKSEPTSPKNTWGLEGDTHYANWARTPYTADKPETNMVALERPPDERH